MDSELLRILGNYGIFSLLFGYLLCYLDIYFFMFLNRIKLENKIIKI